jgi:hypothetical protein
MRKKELIEFQNVLIKKFEEKCDKCISLEETITNLNDENKKLNLKYMALLAKYNKLFKSTLDNETKNITYNGKLYAINGVNHYKKAEEIETVVITAYNIPEKEGLVNSMGKVFKEAYDSINETLFGNKK